MTHVKNNRCHRHYALATNFDVRTGFNFGAHKLHSDINKLFYEDRDMRVRLAVTREEAHAMIFERFGATTTNRSLLSFWHALNTVAPRYGIHRIECAPMYGPRESLASYMTNQLRGEVPETLVAKRLAASAHIPLVGYSNQFPKCITSRHSSNTDFGQRHRRILRMVALAHGIRNESDYWRADPTTRRQLNYETHMRNLATEKLTDTATRPNLIPARAPN